MDDDHVQEASLFLSSGSFAQRPACTKRIPFHWMEAIELSRVAGVIGWNSIQLHPSGEMIPLPPLHQISSRDKSMYVSIEQVPTRDLVLLVSYAS